MKGTSTAVVGFGSSGFACARYLLNLGSNVSVLDDKKKAGSAAGQAELDELARHKGCRIAYYFGFGGLNEQVLSQQDEIFVSPGVNIQEKQVLLNARARGIRLAGDIDLFARERRRLCPQVPLLAITGTNGKSTVTAWLSHVLCGLGIRVATGGNFGRPALDLLSPFFPPDHFVVQEVGSNSGTSALESRVSNPECFVVEVSSFQLELVHDLAATVACILNISADHMDRHADMKAYLAAKMNIFTSCGHVVANRDESLVKIEADSSFGLAEPEGTADFGLRDGHICRGEQKLVKLSDLPVPGRHNQSNAMAVLAFVAACGLDTERASISLRSFDGLAHRCRLVRSLVTGRHRMRFINDSKATNVGAAVAALDGLRDQGAICLLAGGQGKSADFSPLVDALSQSDAAAVLFGEDADRIAEAMGDQVRWEKARDLKHALCRAIELGHKADLRDWLVLLSPACASFDSFRNFEERGDYFECLVAELDAGAAQ